MVYLIVLRELEPEHGKFLKTSDVRHHADIKGVEISAKI